MIRGLIACLALSLALAAPAVARELPDLAIYGRLPAVEQIDLSTDGTRLASVSGRPGLRRLKVFDLASGQLIRDVDIGDTKVRGVTWVGPNHVMVESTETVSRFDTGARVDGEFTQVQIMDVGTGRFVTAFHGMTGLFPSVFGAVQVRETPQGPSAFGLGVYIVRRAVDLFRIAPATGRPTAVEPGDYDIERYAIDADGNAVGRYAYREETRRWWVEVKTNGRWRELIGGPAELDAPVLVGLGRDGRSLLMTGVEAGDDNPVEVAADGTVTDLPLGGAGQIESFIFHPRTGALLGVRLGRSRYEFFDPLANRMWRSVERAFAGRSPRIVSMAADLRRVVVYSTGEEDAGLYHFVDLDAGVADVLGGAYPDLTETQIGRVSSITYAAEDGTEIQAWLTLPPGVTEPSGLPLVVLPHGGPAAHDDGGFDWWSQAIASRGYAVLQPNFRGSTNRDRAFMEAGYGEWGRKMQTDLSDGVRKLAADGLIDPTRVCIVGASYGGYAALAGVTIEQGVYRCAVSVGGVADPRALGLFARRRGSVFNNESVRYWNRFMGVPRVGDPALDEISPTRLAARADAPILLIHGRDDTVVPVQQSRVMATALRNAGKPVQLVELDGEDHWLSLAETRQRMLREMLDFLLAHNPPT